LFTYLRGNTLLYPKTWSCLLFHCLNSMTMFRYDNYYYDFCLMLLNYRIKSLKCRDLKWLSLINGKTCLSTETIFFQTRESYEFDVGDYSVPTKCSPFMT
jgi:hypothetical protein